MENVLITITRQYGSGGRELSAILAKRLGVRRYDKTIVSLAANKMGQGEDLDHILESSYANPETTKPYFQQGGFGRIAEYNRRYVEQAKIILAIADKEKSAVFLGRCADYILKDRPHTYSFFVCADDEFRAARAKTEYDDKTLKELNRIDNERRQYYAYYTGQVWGAPQNYDLVINTSKMPLEKCADLILAYIEAREKA